MVSVRPFISLIILSDKICNNNSQCNIYIENKDILKILCYIVKTVKHNNILLNTISNSNTNIELLINIYNDGCFFDLNKNSDKDQIKFFKKFNSSETIVKKIGELLPSNSGKLKKENIFVLNKEFFKNDGSINIKKYEEIYNNTLDLDKSKEEPVKKDKYKKECNSDQIRNPATGRCVLKRSPTGKKIIAEMNNTGDKEPSKRKEPSKEPSKEPRKKDKKELEKTVLELRKKLSDLRFKFSSNKLKNTKEIGNSKKEVARILTILKELK